MRTLHTYQKVKEIQRTDKITTGCLSRSDCGLLLSSTYFKDESLRFQSAALSKKGFKPEFF